MKWYKPLWLTKKSKSYTPIPVGIEDIAGNAVIDDNSGTWLRVAAECEKAIARIRELNDNPELDERRTAVLRGRIYQLKWVLRLPVKDEEPRRFKAPREEEMVY